MIGNTSVDRVLRQAPDCGHQNVRRVDPDRARTFLAAGHGAARRSGIRRVGGTRQFMRGGGCVVATLAAELQRAASQLTLRLELLSVQSMCVGAQSTRLLTYVSVPYSFMGNAGAARNADL